MNYQKLVTILLVIALSGCESFEQKDSQVFRRLSGERLTKWKSTEQASSLHWPYAWTALAAYQDSDDGKREPIVLVEDCPEPHQFLKEQDWDLWESLPLLRKVNGRAQPETDLSIAMRAVHLRAEVWSNKKENKVIISFGGTAATSFEDWKSNMRWFLLPFSPKDAYHVLENKFVSGFIDEYKNRMKDQKWEWLKDAELVSSGHSLGGGLAQMFAYSIRPEAGIPGVKTVYAFNPSPVSGKLSADGSNVTAKGLTIYRIYKRGEILAAVRSLLQLGNPANERNEGQTWIDIRYRDNWTWKTLLPTGTVKAHGMYDLACYMKKNIAFSK